MANDNTYLKGLSRTSLGNILASFVKDSDEEQIIIRKVKGDDNTLIIESKGEYNKNRKGDKRKTIRIIHFKVSEQYGEILPLSAHTPEIRGGGIKRWQTVRDYRTNNREIQKEMAVGRLVRGLGRKPNAEEFPRDRDGVNKRSLKRKK